MKKVFESSTDFKNLHFPQVSTEDWKSYKWQMRNEITDLKELSKIYDLIESEAAMIDVETKFKVTPYYASLLKYPEIRKTMVPTKEENIIATDEFADPLSEEHNTVTKNLVHRYPDRVLFLTTINCAVNCRFSLLPESKVTMSDGTYKNIEEIVVGDYVKTHLGNSKKVYETFNKDVSTYVTEIKTSLGLFLKATKEHPILTIRKDDIKNDLFLPTFVYSEDIEPGDYVASEIIKDVKKEFEKDCEEFYYKEFNFLLVKDVKNNFYTGKTYDLSIEDDETYIANSIVVHNCTRSRLVYHSEYVYKRKDFQESFDYIREHEEIRDILFSGGDVLNFDDSTIEYLIKQAKSIPHVEVVRFGSKVPMVMPQRITDSLCNIFKENFPIYINIHCTHPAEITEEVSEGLKKLALAGVNMGSQTVLQKGVNDSSIVLKELFHRLLLNSVKPLYTYILDFVEGTSHFRVSLEEAKQIFRELIGFTTGFAVPKLILDLKDSGGKIPIWPEYMLEKDGDSYTFTNFEGREFKYEHL